MSGTHMWSPRVQIYSYEQAITAPLRCADLKSSENLAFNEYPTACLMLDTISRNYANGIMFLTPTVKLHAPHELAYNCWEAVNLLNYNRKNLLTSWILFLLFFLFFFSLLCYVIHRSRFHIHISHILLFLIIFIFQVWWE